MDVKCEKCQARYRIDDARVGPAGLTMRCGKCGNTFKVTKGGATQAVGAAPPPAAAKPPPTIPTGGPPPEGATMMFAAPVIPSKPPPAAARPPGPAGKPPPAPAKPAGDSGAGSTMMFNSPAAAPPKSSPPAGARPGAGKPPPASDAGATVMFAAAPVVAAKTDASAAARSVKPPPQGAGSTMLFGSAAQRPQQPPASSPHEMMTEPGVPSSGDEPEPMQAAEAEPAPRKPISPIQPMQAEEPPMEDPGIVAEGAEITQDTPLVPQPRRIPVVPIAIAAAVLVLALAAFIAWKTFGKQLPSSAALDQIAQAHATAQKDTAADYSTADAQALAALAINRRAFFPVGWAELAEIRVGWADLLREGNAPTSEVKKQLSGALEAINTGLKQDPQNVDLVIAQADYYRSAGANSSYSRVMKKAQSLAANDPRVAMVQGFSAAGEDDGAEKAAPLLKQAAAAMPENARVRYRYAQVLLAAKQDDAAAKELAEVMRLSPGHDRAKKLLDEAPAKAPPQGSEQPAAGKDEQKGK